MSAYEELIPMIHFECARCGRGYVPPRPRQDLSAKGDLNSLRGRGAARAEARRLELIKQDDEAYQMYAQTLHFCAGCREFVCLECWARAAEICKFCARRAAGGAAYTPAHVAPAHVAPVPLAQPWPQPSRFEPAAAPLLPHSADPQIAQRRSARLAAPAEPLRSLGAARPVMPVAPRRSGRRGRSVMRGLSAAVLLLLVLGAAMVLAAMSSQLEASQDIAGETAGPVESLGSGETAVSGGPSIAANPTPGGQNQASGPTASPTPTGTKATPSTRPTVKTTSTPGATATAAATATATATVTPPPTPTPTPTPTVAPLDVPTISCTPSDGVAPYTLNCSVSPSSYLPTDEMRWYLDGAYQGSSSSLPISDDATHSVYLVVKRAGTADVPSNPVSGTGSGWS